MAAGCPNRDEMVEVAGGRGKLRRAQYAAAWRRFEGKKRGNGEESEADLIEGNGGGLMAGNAGLKSKLIWQ